MFNPFTEIAETHSTDAELVEQAKNGDRAALEKLVLQHQAWIYNIAVRMVFSPHDAEEVTQEVLVKVITKLSTFKGESKFRTWLYRGRDGLLPPLFGPYSRDLIPYLGDTPRRAELWEAPQLGGRERCRGCRHEKEVYRSAD